jgi:prophage maintenance system killer protein
LFLARNGFLLEADEVNAADMMFRVASGELSEEELAAWIAQYSAVAERKRT